LELGRIAAWEYARGYWWMFVSIPLFGIVGLVLAPDGVIRYFSMVCLLWPFSIPARAILITRKASRLYSEETVAVIGEGELRLYRPSGRGSSLKLSDVRSVGDSLGALVVRTRKLGFVAIPARAFASAEEREAFVTALGLGS
jgi:hypothetical protein